MSRHPILSFILSPPTESISRIAHTEPFSRQPDPPVSSTLPLRISPRPPSCVLLPTRKIPSLPLRTCQKRILQSRASRCLRRRTSSIPSRHRRVVPAIAVVILNFVQERKFEYEERREWSEPIESDCTTHLEMLPKRKSHNCGVCLTRDKNTISTRHSQTEPTHSTHLTLMTFRSPRSSWSLALRRANLLMLFWSSLRTSTLFSSSAGVIIILETFLFFY